MIVLKIGGCNGSGKTSVVRALLADKSHAWMPVLPPGKLKPQAYIGAVRPPTATLETIAVLGSYENACGGMDTISDKDVRLALVRRYAAGRQLVIFEGLITGKTYGAFGAMSEERSHKGRWLYAFMDTPFEVCVERVMQRRKAAGNDAPFDPERTMRSTFRGCEGARRLATKAGHQVLMLPHKKTPKQIAALMLREAFKLAEMMG